MTQYKILQIIAYIKYNTIQDNTTQNSIQYIYNIIDYNRLHMYKGSHNIKQSNKSRACKMLQINII